LPQLQQRGASLHGLAHGAFQSNKHSQAGSSFVSDAGTGSLDPAISVCANIESIQNVLTALFVASMGLIMSPVFLLHHAAVLLLGTLVVTLVKAAVVTLVVRLFGVPLRLGLAVGLSMAHIGEFSLVLLSMANQLRLLSSQVRRFWGRGG
jgi:predicted Kef-type K+ transport protein